MNALSPVPARSAAADDATRIYRSIAQLIGPACELVTATERPWASATFSGARHSLRLQIALPDADAPAPPGLDRLPDHEFALPGQLVADCAVTVEQRHRDAAGRWWLMCEVDVLTIGAD